MNKLAKIVFIFMFVMCVTIFACVCCFGYTLPKEPKIQYAESEFIGQYTSSDYILTLSKNGKMDIQFRYEAKYKILNNTLFVDFIDSTGKIIYRKKYAFLKFPGHYEIHALDKIQVKLRM